ncbi:MAG: hypothetical protein IMZ50_08840 [Candidatus Atribacteria bacterium]|nr:hypothetical protein [Candidatus Atribacteria bacterium]
MRIRLLTTCGLESGAYGPGAEITVPDPEGALLIRSGKAMVIPDVLVETAMVSHADAEHRGKRRIPKRRRK